MKTELNDTLDPTRRSNDALEFETALRRKLVGQDPAIEKVAEIYQMFLAGSHPTGRPVDNLRFSGSTGVGGLSCDGARKQVKAQTNLHLEVILDWKLATVVSLSIMVILKQLLAAFK